MRGNTQQKLAFRQYETILKMQAHRKHEVDFSRGGQVYYQGRPDWR